MDHSVPPAIAVGIPVAAARAATPGSDAPLDGVDPFDIGEDDATGSEQGGSFAARGPDAARHAGISSLLKQGRLDLAFVLDTTASMQPWIDKAKREIYSLTETIVKSGAVSQVRVAIVAYRDVHTGDGFVYKVCPFTSEITDAASLSSAMAELLRFLGPISAHGGGDGPEAVASAWEQVCKLPWRTDDVDGVQPSNVVIHISDAPPHGLGDTGGDRHTRDLFPYGCPSEPDALGLVDQMANLNIQFFFIAVQGITHYRRALDFYKGVTDRLEGTLAYMDSPDSVEQFVIGTAVRRVEMNSINERIDSAIQTGLTEDVARGVVFRSLSEAGISIHAVDGLSEVEAPSSVVFEKSSSLEEARAKADAAYCVPPLRRDAALLPTDMFDPWGDEASEDDFMGGPCYRSLAGAAVSEEGCPLETLRPMSSGKGPSLKPIASAPRAVKTGLDKESFGAIMKRRDRLHTRAASGSVA